MGYLRKDLCLLNSLLNSLIAETETLMGLEMYNLLVLQREEKDLTRPKALKCVDMRSIRFLQLSVSFTVLWL